MVKRSRKHALKICIDRTEVPQTAMILSSISSHVDRELGKKGDYMSLNH